MTALSRKELLALLPRNKEDESRAVALTRLGYPAVEPVLEHMIDWLRTSGSPVDLALRPFFAALGEPGVPVVRKVLRARHGLHQFTLVAHALPHWPRAALAQLKPELEALATGSGFYGTDLAAMRLLAEHRLAAREWLSEWAAFKVKRLRELLAQAEQVNALLRGESAA